MLSKKVRFDFLYNIFSGVFLVLRRINPLAPGLFFLILAHPVYKNVNNTGTKQVSVMKQTAFRREKNGEYRACLKYSVPIFVE